MPGRRKAFCVGINYAGSDAELRGSVNDALRWAEVLMHHFGFTRNNVLVMIDEYPSGEIVGDYDPGYSRPTQDNVLEGLDWLIQDAAAGDMLLFSFSGHAVQVPESAFAARANERLEDALCPVDWDSFDWGLTPYRVITENVLHQYFSRLPSGVLLTIAVDAALAGIPLRVPLRVDFEYPDREADNEPVTQGDYQDFAINCDAWLRSRHLNALPRRLPEEPSKPLWGRLTRLFAKDTAPPLDEGLAVFSITASRGSQSALDASLEGVAQGCMTYCLMQALDLLNFRCTYLELCEAMDRIAQKLRKDVMPFMDQYFQLAYGKNAGPDECVFLNPASAFVAKDRAKRRRGQRTRPT